MPRLVINGSSFDYEYFIKDHLGNTRVVVKDTLGNAMVKQENHYDPFGYTLAGQTFSYSPGTKKNDYLYNGKELQDELGLDWYDYGARFYDVTLGRFFTQDRFAEKYTSITPYQYCTDNPILLVDFNGDSIVYSNTIDAQAIQDMQNYYTTLSNASPVFAQLYQNLLNSPNIYTIEIGNTKNGVPGQFSPNGENNGGSIKFKNAYQSTTAATVSEEFFHGFQDEIKPKVYSGLAYSNMEYEAKLFSALVLDEAYNNDSKGSQVSLNLLNDGGMESVDNAIIFQNTPLTNKEGRINITSANFKSAEFMKFYRNCINSFVKYWRNDPNGVAGYRENPSNHGPNGILLILNQLNR